jgi:deoxyribodipyrimidine photo-lyase
MSTRHPSPTPAGVSRAGVPRERTQALNAAPLRPERDHVLYWMVAARRSRSNFGLQRAVELAQELGKPLLVLEALRHDYRWASPRLHRFVLDGMADNRAAFARAKVGYHAYVEPRPGAGQGLVEALAARAAAVVTDYFPCFFLPRMIKRTAARLDVHTEWVDGNGLFPLGLTPHAFTRAYSLRRFLQKELVPQLEKGPIAEPLGALATKPAAKLAQLTAKELERWPAAPEAWLAHGATLDHLQLGCDVPIAPTTGGPVAGEAVLTRFMSERFARYGTERNEPQDEVASGLSPYLHFGHVSVHEVFERVASHEDWSPERAAKKATGSKEGWWGMGANAESFIDELVTWRELGYADCHHRPNEYWKYESLPDWARATLEKHERDPRAHVYSLEEFAAGATHDPLWNAAQGQLRTEGRIHNYLRMLWGKKILEWTKSPREALEILIELNNRYALDGRDPNSYSGLFWCLGRYDRAWGPERDVYGTIRYMSSDNTARKVHVKEYVAKYTGGGKVKGKGAEKTKGGALFD